MARGDSKVNRDAGSADADIPLAIVGAATLRKQFKKLRAREARTRQGDDVEALHQMRVANSRLRVALRVFVTDAVREPFVEVEAGARELAHALGAVRDLDVFREELRGRAERISVDAPAMRSLLAALERVRVVRRAELIAVLDGQVARRMEKAFPMAVDELEQTAANRETVASDAPRLIKKRLKKVVRSADELLAPTSTELHRLRIRCKRLRYTAEFFKPWFGRQVESTIKIAADLQDALGAVHDGDVSPDSLQALVDTALAGGQAESVGGYELTRAILSLIQDRHRQRDEQLLRYQKLIAELRSIHEKARFYAR